MTQLPAFLQTYQRRDLAKTVLANLGAGSPPYVSIAGNRFTLIDGAGNEQPVGTFDPQQGPYLDVCIFDVLGHVSKVYYASAFDPSAQQYMPPDCWSDNGVGPSRNAANPQSALCAQCPQNVWGSATSKVSNKGVKACHDQQKIALLVAGQDMPFLLRIPPNSLKNFRAYTAQFQGQAFDFDVVTTRITFEPGQMGTLRFTAIGYVDEKEFGRMQQMRNEQRADLLLGRNDVPIAAAALPAPELPSAPSQANYARLTTASAPAQVAPAMVQQPAPAVAAPAPFGAPVSPPVSAPFATSPSMPLAPQPTPTAPPAPAASPSEAPRRRRRTQAEIAADNAAKAQAAAPAQSASFTPAPQAPAPQPAPFAPFRPAEAQQAPAVQANTGIQQGVAPPPELKASLDSFFGKQ